MMYSSCAVVITAYSNEKVGSSTCYCSVKVGYFGEAGRYMLSYLKVTSQFVHIPAVVLFVMLWVLVIVMGYITNT